MELKQKCQAGKFAGGTAFWLRSPLRDWSSGLVLLVITVIAYLPVWHAGFIWDDDHYVTSNNALRSLHGLWQIWFQPGVTSQYYPLTFTVFWLEYHLWGFNPLGFHLVNVFLHSFNAILLWLLLRKLGVRGAWLAGAIFAVHPVTVMSVAWITELKNTLSNVLALGSCYAYVCFENLGWRDVSQRDQDGGVRDSERRRFYVLSLALFLLAMLAKTGVSFLPLTILLIVWWWRERMVWRDVLPLIPMTGIAVLMGA